MNKDIEIIKVALECFGGTQRALDALARLEAQLQQAHAKENVANHNFDTSDYRILEG